jgi:hypothetical protein
MAAGGGRIRWTNRHDRREVGAAATDLDRLRDATGTRRTDPRKGRHVRFFGNTTPLE